jgi:hypothetical protein
VPQLRRLVSWSLLFCFPVAMAATDNAETARAMMYTHGKVEINGASTLPSMALFAGDAVATQADSVANITAEGSSVLVMPNSSVKFEGKSLDLDHGDVVIATSKRLALKADQVTVAPATDKQSKFEVAENEDTVTIAARTGDLTVTDDQGTSTVPEGQQTTKHRKKSGAAAPSSGGIMSGKTAAILAGAGGAATLAAVLATGSGSKKCMSPGTSNCKCTQNQQGNNNCQ